MSRLLLAIAALAVAGALLMSRRLSSRTMIGAVDWQLLLLFVCLFGVTAAFGKTGLSQEGLAWLTAQGLLPDRLSVLAPLTLVASNTIGNVPAVILLIELVPDLSDGALTALALLSTFAGNLLLTGSLCNIIVAERATWLGTIPIGYGDGYRRALTNNADVLIDGRRFPVVGTVSMDNITVDLGDEPPDRGAEAVLIGARGDERILAEELAVRIGTINYEITCGISARVPREHA